MCPALMTAHSGPSGNACGGLCISLQAPPQGGRGALAAAKEARHTDFRLLEEVDDPGVGRVVARTVAGQPGEVDPGFNFGLPRRGSALEPALTSKESRKLLNCRNASHRGHIRADVALNRARIVASHPQERARAGVAALPLAFAGQADAKTRARRDWICKVLQLRGNHDMAGEAEQVFHGGRALRSGTQRQRPLWPLLTAVTLAAVILYVVRERGDGPLMHELGVFSGTWLCIAAFALLGRAIFRRRTA